MFFWYGRNTENGDGRAQLGSIAGAVDVKTTSFATIYILYNSNLCRIA